MREQLFLIKSAATIEFHTRLRNALSNIKDKESIRNHPFIHETLITIVIKVTVVNQIRASDVN